MTNRWERDLKVTNWTSDYSSVNRLLIHLRRKSGSVASRCLYCSTLDLFCLFVGKSKGKPFLTPDEILNMSKKEIEGKVQDFCDLKLDSRRYAITQMNVLKTFFKVNGFKGGRELDVESYSLRGFGRKKPEYIPTLSETLKMAYVAGSLKNKAIVLLLLSTGLRVSTLCAILYGDVKEELEKGVERLHISIYEGMKKIVPNAAKGRRAYHTFTSPECTEAIRLYLRERILKLGRIDDSEPLFIPELGRLRRVKRVIRPLTSRDVQLIVKEAARKAGIKKWHDVTPHAIRKTYCTWVLCSPLADGGRLDGKTQEILMGHTLPGSQDVYYDRTKIEELRKEHAKLVFTPRIEGRVEPYEILRILSNILDVDFIELIESEKIKLRRSLSSEEQLRIVKETLQKLISSIRRLATVPEKKLETIESPQNTDDKAKSQKAQRQQRLLSDCEPNEQETKHANCKKHSPLNQPQTGCEKSSQQKDLLSFY